MYLAKLQLKNWRTYADAEFDFKEPAGRRSVVLVGALNGRGKTSFLTSLYLGLFGRFGLRYCEGYTTAPDGDPATYRQAIERFRRDVAARDEPTEIDITFSPTVAEVDEEAVRVVRRWHFTGTNKLKQNEYEEVAVYMGGKLVKLPRESDPITAAHERIERTLFPAHVSPAFFFDGEQAQRLIENMGEAGIRKAVEVMFGTKVLGEVAKTISEYLGRARANVGGARRASDRQKQMEEKVVERDHLNAHIAKIQEDHIRLEHEKDTKERDRARLQEELARLGGAAGADAAKLQGEIAKADKARQEAEHALASVVRRLGISLALTRLEPAIVNRLKSEESREAWEGLRRGTIENKEKVLAVALPEPAEADPLLGNLPAGVRAQVRDRFIEALERIYNPPPLNCAPDFIMGHIRGESRPKALAMLAEASNTGAGHAKAAAKKVRETREAQEELKAKNDRIQHLPKATTEIKESLDGLNGENQQISRKLGLLEAEIKKCKADLHTLNEEIGRVQEELARLEPEQKRIAVSERIGRAVNDLLDVLRPTTTKRLEDQVTEHFLRIADPKFQGGKVLLPHGATPEFEWPNGNRLPLETLSGFEKRSFGIAFSLALAGITQRRVPLVIDTPLGNADSKYRPRALRALADFDIDQVIILTHDQEVTPQLSRHIDKAINQTFLIELCSREEGSLVSPNKYFEGYDGS